MESNILRIDLDIKTYNKTIKLLKERLSYMHDIRFMDISFIKKIELIYKSNYSCKIYCNHNFSPEWIVILQLLLGSDYMKEVNTLINHFKLDMQYSNRMFTVKRYKNNKIIEAEIIDITNKIINYIKSNKRNKFYN